MEVIAVAVTAWHGSIVDDGTIAWQCAHLHPDQDAALGCADRERRHPGMKELGQELRRYREEAKMTIEYVVDELEWSMSKLSRIENGQIRVHFGDLPDLLDLYGVEDPDRTRLINEARRLRGRGPRP